MSLWGWHQESWVLFYGYYIKQACQWGTNSTGNQRHDKLCSEEVAGAYFFEAGLWKKGCSWRRCYHQVPNSSSEEPRTHSKREPLEDMQWGQSCTSISSSTAMYGMGMLVIICLTAALHSRFCGLSSAQNSRNQQNILPNNNMLQKSVEPHLFAKVC